MVLCRFALTLQYHTRTVVRKLMLQSVDLTVSVILSTRFNFCNVASCWMRCLAHRAEIASMPWAHGGRYRYAWCSVFVHDLVRWLSVADTRYFVLPELCRRTSA